jgi:hypothetical protein
VSYIVIYSFYFISAPTLFVCWPMALISWEKEAVRKRVQQAKTLRTDAYREKDATWNRSKRAKTLRTDADRTIDAVRQGAKRARKIAKQGLKELVNGASYRELQAVKIHDLLRDEKDNFVAPLKLPDTCRGAEKCPDIHLT